MHSPNHSEIGRGDFIEPLIPAPLPARGPERDPQPKAPLGPESERAVLTLISFGFKYGQPPANHYFDVSFLKNPAREARWGLWSEPEEEMRQWVLGQAAAGEFLDALVPLAQLLARADDGARIALGCSAGRHRSTILTEELARRLRAAGLEIKVLHRERKLT